mgnify:FL=1
MSRVGLRVRASFAVLLASVGVAVQAAEVRSPDGQTVVTVDVDKNGAPRYAVARNVTAADTLELALASSGGAAIRFKQAR